MGNGIINCGLFIFQVDLILSGFCWILIYFYLLSIRISLCSLSVKGFTSKDLNFMDKVQSIYLLFLYGLLITCTYYANLK